METEDPEPIAHVQPVEALDDADARKAMAILMDPHILSLRFMTVLCWTTFIKFYWN